MGIRPDLQISVGAAQSIVDRVIPGHAVATVSNIHGGEIAAVYEIGLVGGHPPIILKIYPDALHWKMHKEVIVAGLVQDRLSVPAPRVLLADDSRKLLDLSFVVMNRVNGASLGSLEKTLPPEQLVSAYVQIGQLLREFHRIPMDAFGYIGSTGILTPHATNHAYLTHQFQRKLDEFVTRGGDAPLARKVAGILRTARSSSTPVRKPCFATMTCTPGICSPRSRQPACSSRAFWILKAPLPAIR